MFDSLQLDALDILVNGPSSVSGVYADLVFLLNYGRDVSGLLSSAIEDLEHDGLVFSRTAMPSGEWRAVSFDERKAMWRRYFAELPNASRSDLAVDEIGLWYGITDDGREAWRALGGDSGAALWQLDDDAAGFRIVVVSESDDSADRALAWWLKRHDRYRILSKERLSAGEAMLRNGRSIKNGVKTTCSYVVEHSKVEKDM